MITWSQSCCVVRHHCSCRQNAVWEICRTQNCGKSRAVPPATPYHCCRRYTTLGEKSSLFTTFCTWWTRVLCRKMLHVQMARGILVLWFLLASGVEAGWGRGCENQHGWHLLVDLESLMFCWVGPCLTQFLQFVKLSATKPRRCYKAPSGKMM